MKSMKPVWPTPTPLIRGHGRRNELEADEAGAEYMAKLGYAPSEMISMLSMMKDYEALQKNGPNPKVQPSKPTMASFPPTRATTVACAPWSAKPMPLRPKRAEAMAQAVYRSLTQGLIWGENFLAKEKKPERFSDMRLRVRFDFPKGWVQDSSNTKVTGHRCSRR